MTDATRGYVTHPTGGQRIYQRNYIFLFTTSATDVKRRAAEWTRQLSHQEALLSEPEISLAQLNLDTRAKTGKSTRAPWQIYLTNVTSYLIQDVVPLVCTARFGSCVIHEWNDVRNR